MLYFLPKRFTEFKNWVVRLKLGGDHSAVNGMSLLLNLTC